MLEGLWVKSSSIAFSNFKSKMKILGKPFSILNLYFIREKKGKGKEKIIEGFKGETKNRKISLLKPQCN